VARAVSYPYKEEESCEKKTKAARTKLLGMGLAVVLVNAAFNLLVFKTRR